MDQVLRHALAAHDLFSPLVIVRDLGELPLRLLDAALGFLDIYLLHRDGLLDQDLDQVLGDLEETVGGGVDAPLLALVDADLPDLDRRDGRGVVNQDPELAVRDPRDDQVGLVVEDRPLRRDDPAEELPALAPLLASLRHRRSSPSSDSPSSDWPSSSSEPSSPSGSSPDSSSPSDWSSDSPSSPSSPSSSSSPLIPRAFSIASSMLPTR